MAKRKKSKPKPGPAWRAAERAGIDMSLIEINLTKSYQERMKAHDRALNQILELRWALEKSRGRS